MTVPGRRRAPFAVVTTAMLLAVLALGTLPHPTRVERAAATGADPGPAAAAPRRVAGRAAPETQPPETVVAGLHAVGRGDGVRPGRYVTSSDLCSWERRRVSGEVLASDTGSGQVLVEVRATDGAFSSAPGCGTWRALDDDEPQPPLPSFGPG